MDVQLKIKEEVQKQLNAGFLTVARYPEWVANKYSASLEERWQSQNVC